MSRYWFRAFFVVAAAYIGLCLMLFFSQRSFIYFPTDSAFAAPASTATLNVPGASLQLSIRSQEGPNALIYFGGNAEDVSKSLPLFSAEFPNHAIYLLHYRGYGNSSGKPSENALYSDAKALFEMAKKIHSNITIIGRSLGSGIAVRLASTHPVDRLVLVTPYDSIVNLAKQQFPYVPVDLLLQERFESWRYAPKVKAPTTIVAAEHDEVISRASTMALYDSFAPGIAAMRVIQGAGHNSISLKPKYAEALTGA